jgi:hypothetical protein
MPYKSFKKLSAMLGKQKDVKDPDALAASIARKKYGKDSVQEHAAKGTSMQNVKPKKHYG